MTLYSPEVREYIRSRDWPKGLTLEIEENYTELDEGLLAPYLQIIFFRDNFNSFDAGTQLRIAQTMNEVMMKLRNDEIPCYLEVRAHVNAQ